MKKLLSLIMAFAFAMSMNVTALAADKPQTTITIEDWGDGITAVVTTTISDVSPATRAAWSTKVANRTWTIYNGSASVGSVSLDVRFEYNGSSSRVDSYSTDHSVKSGWKYGSERVSSSSGKCTISGKFTGTKNISFSKSISCSPSGVIS